MMHPLLGLSSMLIVLLTGALLLGVLRRMRGWARRRDLQLLVLAAPVVSLGLGLGSLHHFTGRICFVGAPPWDYRLGVALPLWMGLIALGGLIAGLLRLALMYRVLSQRGAPAGAEVQAVAARLADHLGVARPCVRLCAYGRPLALTYGLLRPTVLLSSWIVERLDPSELEAVLAHELGHVARRDYLVVWLATMLRDAFVYLPTSWAAHRQLLREKEPACDDLAVGATRRPLALASALAKVWQPALDGPHISLAQPLTERGDAIAGRIERLLRVPQPAAGTARARLVALGVGMWALAALLALQGANIALLLAPMGCGPSSPLGKLL